MLQGLLGISALLAVPEYRGAVLEGLVASIGGLDASLSKDATAAFVQTLTPPGPGGLTTTSGLAWLPVLYLPIVKLLCLL